MDRKSLAIMLGTAVGIAAVAATATVYVSNHREEAKAADVNQVVEQARETVRKLDEALELLRRSATA